MNHAEEEHLTIVAKVRKFSNEHIHGPGDISREFMDYYTNCGYPIKYLIGVCPNSRSNSTEGFISVYLYNTMFFQALCRITHAELTCSISIVDAEGNRRFLQSFGTCFGHMQNFEFWTLTIDNYISRSILLKEPSEFLTNDTLTLKMDIMLRKRCVKNPKFNGIPNFERYPGPDGTIHYFCLDSALGKRLAETSPYFERMLDTPMVEKSLRRMRVPDDEVVAFLVIECILLDNLLPIEICSIDDIFDVYTTADKYDIGFVVNTCRVWLFLCISLDTASQILKLAENFDDEFLQVVVEDFAIGEVEANRPEEEAFIPHQYWECENWACERYMIKGNSRYRFTSKLSSPAEDTDESKDEIDFDFYS